MFRLGMQGASPPVLYTSPWYKAQAQLSNLCYSTPAATPSKNTVTPSDKQTKGFHSFSIIIFLQNNRPFSPRLGWRSVKRKREKEKGSECHRKRRWRKSIESFVSHSFARPYKQMEHCEEHSNRTLTRCVSSSLVAYTD
jgi:hypothetical protein